MAQFTKASLTIAQKIAHLQAAGMAIPDVPMAEHWLRHVSYYRLSAYWLPFEKPKQQPGPRFQPGTSFDTVIALYQFDRRLRLLILDAIERIEVAIRGGWAYALAHQGGPHGYLNAALYSDRKRFHENLSRLARDVGSSPETYVDHYRRTYDDPAMPPAWMVAEMMSFGQLSRWLSSLSSRAIRNKIAAPLALDEKVMVPLLKHLSTVRNTCAHHGRLWNRGFLIRPSLPHKPADLAATLEPPTPQPALLYNSLVLITFLLKQVDPPSLWKDDLKAHIATHPTGNLAAMGFPAGWDQRPLWL
ncbi:Abi family protein [Sphingopyxis terrae]|uniref:Abi family protein n=1 Tax=Sphingopyxis terrae TaxID=33052 RepID=UPI001C2BE363|nr:Abi family protein [Sphingopyxis terrae]QXF11100.1 Abi family protein [Sphingopyxis terrae subsp. terrae]